MPKPLRRDTIINPVRRQAIGGNVRVDRRPLPVHCSCGHLDVLIMPNTSGQIKWLCHTCGADHGIGFAVDKGSPDGTWRGPVQRQPIHFVCRVGGGDCKYETAILLPAGNGEMKFDCPACHHVWGMKFRDDGRVDWYKVI